MTQFQLFIRKWSSGCGACECESAKNIVHYRGDMPCDILFVGEGPGKNENNLGVPFIGQAGKRLDEIVKESVNEKYLRGFMNLVGCKPESSPTDEQIEACKPRTEELIAIAEPKLIVCVGKHARDFLEQGFKWSVKVNPDIPQCHIEHPAHMLRQNHSQQIQMKQRAVAIILGAIERELEGEEW